MSLPSSSSSSEESSSEESSSEDEETVCLLSYNIYPYHQRKKIREIWLVERISRILIFYTFPKQLQNQNKNTETCVFLSFYDMFHLWSFKVLKKISRSSLTATRNNNVQNKTKDTAAKSSPKEKVILYYFC